MLKGENEANLPPVILARKPVRRRKVAPPPGAWSVVLIDGAPARKRARREYEKVLRDLELARAEAERFENEDKPKFAKWLSGNFGAVLTELRELQEKLYHVQELVNEVQQEFYYGNYRSISGAYQKVMHRMEHPEELERELKKEEEEEAEFRRRFEDIFGEAEKARAQSQESGEAEPEAPSKKPHRAGGVSRLKNIYRRLVRRLHPDKGAQRSRKEVEWWHQTQAAYHARDAEQLELILTLVEIQDKGATDASVSVLAQLTNEFKKSLRGLKRQIAGYRKERAWNFSAVTSLEPLFALTRSELEMERARTRQLLQKYEGQISTWKTATARPHARKTAAQRRGMTHEEELF